MSDNLFCEFRPRTCCHHRVVNRGTYLKISGLRNPYPANITLLLTISKLPRAFEPGGGCVAHVCLDPFVGVLVRLVGGLLSEAPIAACISALVLLQWRLSSGFLEIRSMVSMQA